YGVCGSRSLGESDSGNCRALVDVQFGILDGFGGRAGHYHQPVFIFLADFARSRGCWAECEGIPTEEKAFPSAGTIPPHCHGYTGRDGIFELGGVFHYSDHGGYAARRGWRRRDKDGSRCGEGFAAFGGKPGVRVVRDWNYRYGAAGGSGARRLGCVCAVGVVPLARQFGEEAATGSQILWCAGGRDYHWHV